MQQIADYGIQTRASGHSCNSQAATRVTPCALPGVFPQFASLLLPHTAGPPCPECLHLVLASGLPIFSSLCSAPFPWLHCAHTNTHPWFFQDRGLGVLTLVAYGMVILLGSSAVTSFFFFFF